MATSPAAEPPRGRQVRNPLSLRRVESAVSRSAAGFGIAFFAQSAPAMLSQLPNTHEAWNIVFVASIVSTLVFAVAAAVSRRYVRISATTFSAVYLIGLLTWPFAVLDPSRITTDSFWLYGIMTVATSMAAIGLPVRWASIYLVAIPSIYAIIRLTPPGGAVGPSRAALDSVFALILGGVITIIFVMLRTAAASVDRAQQTALERYSHAVRQHAIEAERVQVDAIVHDSVLTTLLSAARAYTPEANELAATMAGNAIGHLRDAVAVAPDTDTQVPAVVLFGRISEAAATMSQPFEVRSLRLGRVSMPIPVAEALYSAAVQGMVNSLQHAGADVARWVEVKGMPRGAIQVEVGDDGAGFDVATVPTERLGVRVSILERMSSAGGHADIVSAPGSGTRVVLRWPDERPAGSPSYARFAAASEAGELA
ncbi:MAG TPA: ATP-binding protein [Pseudolysinimonas sp.]|jgi:signal transduction histidine kinase|nr:ATP-binding protein [Pseudolysinimonas sp.]